MIKMRRWMLLCLFLVPATAMAYPYYAGPYRVFRPVDDLPPTGAALGPWPWNFNFGGGPTAVTGSNNPLTGGWNFVVGSGYNFSPRLGLDLELMNAGMGVTRAAMAQQQALDASASVWSVTLDPIWRFRIGGPVGGYLIGGGGFYERDIRYSEPGEVFVPTYRGGFFAPGTGDVHQIDDTGGVNAGAGLTCNLGWGTKLFVEARYHYLFTSGSATQIIPITIGLRW